MRKAPRRLHTEGLVHFEPNQGAFVRQWSAVDANDIFQLRAMIESFAAQRAARNASDSQLAELRRLAESQQRESQKCRDGHLERIAHLNSRFHQLVQEAAGRERLRTIMAVLTDAPLVFRTFRGYNAKT